MLITLNGESTSTNSSGAYDFTISIRSGFDLKPNSKIALVSASIERVVDLVIVSSTNGELKMSTFGDDPIILETSNGTKEEFHYDLPEALTGFDTVFSMGVLYHRKSHLEHIQKLKSLLRDGGELVLETLVLDTHEDEVLIPEGRYAKMRNVWAVPSLSVVKQWVEECGFSDVNIVDVNQTSVEEQRVTDWMVFESLAEYLDPEDRNKTLEGHPAPVRATLIARK